MKDMRMLGNKVSMLARENGMSDASMCDYLDCKTAEYNAFLKGCVLLSPKQLDDLATLFNITMGELLQGDIAHYEQTVVHCMGQFENPENREEVLDIINDYVMLKSAVSH